MAPNHQAFPAAFQGIPFLAILLSLALALSCPISPAWGDEEENGSSEDTPKTAYELQQDIANAQADYAAAREAADKANEQAEEHRQRIDEIERQIPAQQERTAQATRELYKFQQQAVGIVEMLLNSGSLEQFLSQYEYFSRVNDANYAEIERLNAMKQELADTEEQLRQAQAEANAHVEETESAIDAAMEAQAEAQRRLEEEARLTAAAAANAANLISNPRSNTEGGVPDGSSAEADKEPTAPEPAPEPEAPSAPEPDPAPAPDPAPETSGDEASFIAQWAPRIDAYLAGSPLAGQGTTFARAAYTYNVDPRFSPAISCTESGKGSACFRPHNAWGWGSASWDSWEEAIDAHVRGLSQGYGYTITEEGAKKYCPPNWQHWYNTTLGQMNLI